MDVHSINIQEDTPYNTGQTCAAATYTADALFMAENGESIKLLQPGALARRV